MGSDFRFLFFRQALFVEGTNLTEISGNRLFLAKYATNACLKKLGMTHHLTQL